MADELSAALLEASGQGLLILRALWTPQGNVRDFRCTHANAPACEILGIPAASLMGMEFRNGQLPVFDPALSNAWLATFESGISGARNLIVKTTRGPRHVQLSWAKAGEELALAVADLTELDSMAKARTAAERLLNVFFDTVPQAMYVKNRAGRYTSVNKALTEMWGQTAKDILGNAVIAAHARPNEEAVLALDSDRAVLETGISAEVERTSTFPDGSHRTVRIRKAALRDENDAIVGLVGVTEDLTAERQALESLRVSEQRLRNILDGSLQGIAIVVEGRIVFANPAYAKMFGYASVEELMQIESVLQLVAEHERERLRRYATQRIAGQQVPEEYEMEALRKDGSSLWVLVTVRVVDWNGRPASQAAFVNITDRKRAELALTESAQTLRSAQAVAHIGSWSLRFGVPGSLQCSDEAFRIYGIRRAEFDGETRTVLKRVHPEDRPSVQERVRQARRTSLPYLSRHRIVMPDGTIRWVLDQAEIQCDAAGNPTHFVGTVQDITERMAAQLALEASERRQRQILEGSLTGIAVAQDGKFVFINEVGALLHGYESPAEIVGLSVRQLVPPDSAPRHRLTPEDYTGGAPRDHWEMEYLRKDGSRFWVLVRGKEVEWEGRPGFQVTFMDISDRKRAEEALGVAHSRLMDAIESIPGGFALYDAQERLVLANSISKQIWSDLGLEFKAGESITTIARALLGKLEGLNAEDLDKRVAEALRAYRSGAGSLEVRTRNNRILRWHTSRGSHGATIVMGLDITDERLREEQFMQAQKLEAIGQLTGGVAHDFNNLLTVILGNADLLAGAHGDAELVNNAVRMIVQAAHRGAELTQRLLAYARRQPLQPIELDLNRVLAGMEELLRRTLGEVIEIEIVQSAGLWRTLADDGQVQNAILNLALNARDAMPEGGRLTLETANVRLDREYSLAHEEVKSGQYVLLSVTDCGTGMPADVAARAFDPFFTTKQVGKGTGLGLSMVYGFVKQSGGHVKIYSEPGHGTSVKIYLPRTLALATAPRSVPAAEDLAPTGTESILVVEDDALVRSSVVAQIESLGYAVREAADAEAALAILSSAPGIDLLFTDVVLRGGRNGRELATEAQRLAPKLRVLFTSGYSENAIVHHGRLDPDIQLLSKPYRKTDLAAKLREVLGEGSGPPS